MTFEQFEQFPDDGMKHELLEGEHIVRPPAKSRHTRIQQKMQDVLRPFVLERWLGEVHIEAGFRLTGITGCNRTSVFLDPRRLIPAIPAVITKARLR